MTLQTIYAFYYFLFLFYFYFFYVQTGGPSRLICVWADQCQTCARLLQEAKDERRAAKAAAAAAARGFNNKAAKRSGERDPDAADTTAAKSKRLR